MSRFSKKYGYNRKTSQEVIEDAPEWTRIAYLDGILIDLLYVDGDSRYKNEEDRPIGAKELLKEFALMCRVQLEQEDFDSWYCIDRLNDHLKSTDWYYFFDLVELVGIKLKEREGNYLFEEDKQKQFGYTNYKKRVNDLLNNDNIIWKLNDDSELQKSVPEIMEKMLRQTESKLSNGLEAARTHYKKAFRYLFTFQTDTENGIKEIVSAVESIGRTIYPKAATLGDVIKELKKEPNVPKMLISIIEKYYAFANSTPAVRHGSSESSKLETSDGEFVFYIGVALTRYLIKIKENKNSTYGYKT